MWLEIINCTSENIIASPANEARHLLSSLLQKWMKIEVETTQ